MSTKLSLTIDQEIINKAKKYAKEQQRSLSNIVEEYLRMITKDEKTEGKIELTPIVQSLKGA